VTSASYDSRNEHEQNEIKVDGDTDAGGVGCVYTPKPSSSMMGFVRVPL